MDNTHPRLVSRLFRPSAFGLALFAVLALGVSACSSTPGEATRGGGTWKKRPVVYPNDHYHEVGEEVAQMDISGCMYRADSGVGNTSTGGEVAKNTVGGAAIGAAVGVVGGAIVGSPGTGAAVGAAVGGTGGLARGAYKSRENDPTWRGFVERCLGDKGYEVIGWK